MRSKIDRSEAVEVGELKKDAARRSIRVRLECHRADSVVELNVPDWPIGFEVNHGRSFILDRATHRKLSVGSYVDIVNAAIDRNAFDTGQRRSVDYVDGAGLGPNTDKYALSVSGDSQIVRAVGKRYLLQDFTILAIYNIKYAFGFVTDIDSGAIGRKSDSVRQFDTMNDLDDFVGGRVDSVDRIASAVGDENPHR